MCVFGTGRNARVRPLDRGLHKRVGEEEDIHGLDPSGADAAHVATLWPGLAGP